jgi:hypothetical protein
MPLIVASNDMSDPKPIFEGQCFGACVKYRFNTTMTINASKAQPGANIIKLFSL